MRRTHSVHSIWPWLLFLATFFVTEILATPPLPSFAQPPASSRPKFRYWFPDASIPPSAVQSDITSLASISGGGLQFLGFYNQGFPPVSTDWTRYGFGTPAFKELLRAALQTTAQHGLLFDFAVGPNTAHGIPAVPRSEGLAMELVYGVKTLNASQTLTTLPQPVLEFNHAPLNGWVHEPENWGESELIAVIAGKVKSRSRRSSGSGGKVTEQVVLEKEGVVDLTGNFTATGAGGRFSWTAPVSPAGQTWVVMTFYQRYSNERSCVSSPGASSWIGNGSWMVDHFSAAGAKKVADFWDGFLLDDKEIDGLMRQVGLYSWEDSMEMMAPLWWTRGFLEKFRRSRGYDGTKYLPVFFQAKNLWNSYGEPYDTSYVIDGEPTDGGKYAEDYRLTLTEGYQEYLAEHQRWAAARGMGHSTQPAYNMPLDMSAAIPLVAAPELESLGFGESIDNYRQFSGPAHLAGRNTISTEIGAQRGGAYAQTVPNLLNLFLDSFAAGVNTLVIHGLAYGGPYPGTTWPGYTPFQYEFCEMWGPRQPAWRHLNDTMLFAARTSEVLKTGVPKVDLAFYAWKHPWSTRAVYNRGDLNTAGYTYEYLGPANLASPEAVVKDGILSPDGPAYKALVIYSQTRITPSAAEALLRFAKAGLPIFVVGVQSMTTVGAVGQEMVTNVFSQLTNGSFKNVRVLQTTTFGPEALYEAGVYPRVMPEALNGATNASQLYSTWRRAPEKGLDLVFLLNRGQESTFRVSVTASETAVPYRLDAWTGEQTALSRYLRTSDGISLTITLTKGQSFILGLLTVSEKSPPEYVVSSSSNIARVTTDGAGHLIGYIDDLSEATALLSSNAEVTISPVNPNSEPNNNEIPVISLGPWRLSVESYSAPTTLTTTSVTPNRARIDITSPLTSLTPWTKIPGLERISGIGTYRTTFTLPAPLGNETEAYTLHLTKPILNTLRIFINGQVVPALDPFAPDEGRDITRFLFNNPSASNPSSGERKNEVEIVIEVSSTLFNAVKARVKDVKSVGMGVRVPRYYEGAWREFGLVGEVVVKRWRVVRLS